MAYQRQTRVVTSETDRYSRTIERVWIGSIDVNAELVRTGKAWVYRQYLHDPALLVLEADARQARRALWRLPEADRQPPWLWRREHRGW